MPGFAFPFLPRHLTLAAFLTIGIPSFVLALRPRTARSTAAGCCARWPPSRSRPGVATALGSILSFFLVDTVFGGSLEAGRTAATTTLIVLGLGFVLLLERGPGREHIAIQSYMLAMVAGARRPLRRGSSRVAPVRDFFEMALLDARPVVPRPALRRRRPDDRQPALAPAADRTPGTAAGTGRDSGRAHARGLEAERVA